MAKNWVKKKTDETLLKLRQELRSSITLREPGPSKAKDNSNSKIPPAKDLISQLGPRYRQDQKYQGRGAMMPNLSKKAWKTNRSFGRTNSNYKDQNQKYQTDRNRK